jgi:hypothetical protein
MISGKIMAVEKANDVYENLIIWICFTDDTGKEFPFYRGGTLLEKDGHNVWPLMCRWENFVGKTALEIDAWVKANIESQAENVIKALARPVFNTAILKDDLLVLVGKIYTKSDAKVSETIAIKEDGTVVK